MNILRQDSIPFTRSKLKTPCKINGFMRVTDF
jgi:hypothetical protein